MNNANNKFVHIVSEEGADMMTLEKFGRDKDRLTVQGALMGAWSATMYVGPQDAWKMIGMLLNLKLIGYFLSLPFILLRQKSKNNQ